ncbi:MAG TPA: EamA family transporter [Gaiellaceae bacterium]|nr:EamA family transporter [Gaiellaceae bacterium]
MRASSERVALAAFLAQSVLAGGNAVGVRFSNRELDPLWGAALRFLLAALALGLIAAVLRVPLPRGRALAGALLYGAVTFGAAFGLIYVALVELHAGFGQILFGLVPLATLLLAAAQGQERLRPSALAGAVVALAGVALMSRAPLEESVPALSLAAALGAVACFAQGAVVVRRFPPVHPAMANALGMATGAVLLLALALPTGSSLALPRAGETWLAVGYLVVVGSLVFALYVLVLHRWEASRTAFGFVLTPVVTVLLSAWLDDEPLTAGLLAGGALVLGGVYLGAVRRPRRGGVYASSGRGIDGP